MAGGRVGALPAWNAVRPLSLAALDAAGPAVTRLATAPFVTASLARASAVSLPVGVRPRTRPGCGTGACPNARAAWLALLDRLVVRGVAVRRRFTSLFPDTPHRVRSGALTALSGTCPAAGPVARRRVPGAAGRSRAEARAAARRFVAGCIASGVLQRICKGDCRKFWGVE